MVKAYWITTTNTHADHVIREIFRIDPEATIAHRQENKTLMEIRTEKASSWTIEAIDGVAHVVDCGAIVTRASLNRAS